MKSTLIRRFGLLLTLILVSCVGLGAPLATPAVDSTPTSLPPDQSRISPTFLPEICNCVLRFDHISIE